MHNIIIGKRRAVAQTKIALVAAALAGRFGVSEDKVTALRVQEKDPVVKTLKEQEAIADLLEDVAQKLGILPAAPADTGEGFADPIPSDEPAAPADTGEGLPEPVIMDVDTKSAGKKKRQ